MNRYYFNKLLTNQEMIYDKLFNAFYNEFWDNIFKCCLNKIEDSKEEQTTKYLFVE